MPDGRGAGSTRPPQYSRICDTPHSRRKSLAWSSWRILHEPEEMVDLFGALMEALNGTMSNNFGSPVALHKAPKLDRAAFSLREKAPSTRFRRAQLFSLPSPRARMRLCRFVRSTFRIRGGGNIPICLFQSLQDAIALGILARFLKNGLRELKSGFRRISRGMDFNAQTYPEESESPCVRPCCGAPGHFPAIV